MTPAYDLEALRVAVVTTQHALAAMMTHDNPPELDEALHTLELALYDFAAAVWPPTEPDPLAAALDRRCALRDMRDVCGSRVNGCYCSPIRPDCPLYENGRCKEP